MKKIQGKRLISSLMGRLMYPALQMIHKAYLSPKGDTNGFLFIFSRHADLSGSKANRKHVRSIKRSLPKPHDWCCVNNFLNESRPWVFPITAGKGPEFRSDMEHFIDEARRRLRSILLSGDYQERILELRAAYDKEEQAAVSPLLQDPAVTEATGSFRKFSPDDRQEGKDMSKTVSGSRSHATLPGDDFGSLFDHPILPDYGMVCEILRSIKSKCSDDLDTFTRQKAADVIRPLVTALKRKYARNLKILMYLDEVEEDILGNLHIFTLPVDADNPASSNRTAGHGFDHDHLYTPYAVNILISRGRRREHPVVYARNAGETDLFGGFPPGPSGRQPHQHFTFARSGILHEANEGLLVIEASWILRRYQLWELLKDAVLGKEIHVIDPSPCCGIFGSGNVVPEAVPFFTTVIITGSPNEYSILSFIDPDFRFLVGKPLGNQRPPERKGIRKRHPGNPADRKYDTKYFDKTARTAVLSLCSNMDVPEDDFEDHLTRLLTVIGRSLKNTGSGLVTSEHIAQAFAEVCPDIALCLDTVIPGRRKNRQSVLENRTPDTEGIIESVKKHSRKVIAYGKQT